MTETTRRSFVKSAAWSVPVIAVAVATPLAAASMPEPKKTPISCEYLQNHGHGGDKKNDWWLVTYSDKTSEVLDNGTVQSDRELKDLCGKKVHNPK